MLHSIYNTYPRIDRRDAIYEGLFLEEVANFEVSSKSRDRRVSSRIYKPRRVSTGFNGFTNDGLSPQAWGLGG